MGGSSNTTKALTIGFGPLGYLAGNELIDKPRKKAEEMMNEQQNAQNKMIKDMESEQARQKSEMEAAQKEAVAVDEAVSSRDAMRRRQRANRARSSGRQGTVLTSPLGVTEEAPSAQKTLLGS